MSNWPDPTNPGVPLNPEQGGWHWVRRFENNWLFPIEWTNDWNGSRAYCWAIMGSGEPEDVAKNICYLGPCLTPKENAAQTARIAKLEAALQFATEYVGRLASTLAKKHYPDQQHFELHPHLLGRIDQIDNMTCGLHRAALEGGKDE